MCERAPKLLAAASSNLGFGAWQKNGRARCLMAALVPGADGVGDCVEAGWPKWLAQTGASLYDATCSIGGKNVAIDATLGWAQRFAKAVSIPLSIDRAASSFLCRSLETIKKNEPSPLVEGAILLISGKLNETEADVFQQEIHKARLTSLRNGEVHPEAKAACKASWHALQGEVLAMMDAVADSREAAEGPDGWYAARRQARENLILSLREAAV